MVKKPFLLCQLFCLSVVLAACSLPTTPSAGEVTATSPAPTATFEIRPVLTPTSPASTATLEIRQVFTPTNLPATDTPAPGISLDTLKNFTYVLEDFHTKASFKEGVFDGQSGDQMQELHGQLIEPVAAGDLNGDGRLDAAVILTINSGGTGTFFYLIAMLNQDDAPVQAATTYIGDRQAVNKLEIVDGKIILDFRTQGPNDGLCCPSEHRLRRYVLENGALDILSDQVIE